MAERLAAYLGGDSAIALPGDRELWEHQRAALDAIHAFLAAGHHRGYVVLPTGTGKTVIFSALARVTGARTLIVTPKKVLVAQVVREYRKYLNDEDVDGLGQVSGVPLQILQLPGDNHHAQVLVTTAASLRRRDPRLAQHFDLVIVDEAHGMLTGAAQAALREVGDAVKIAFTATPDYVYTRRPGGRRGTTAERVERDGSQFWRDPERSVGHFFPHQIYELDIRDAIEGGLLAPLRAGVVRFQIDLSELQTREAAGRSVDYDDGQLVRALDRGWPELVGAVLDLYRRGADDGRFSGIERKQAVAFLPSVQQAQRLAQELTAAGVRAEAVWGEMSDLLRETIFEHYRPGEVQVLTSVEVLREGWDMPTAEVALMLRPTTSRVLYQQCLGRVLRLDEENPHKEAFVIDFIGQHAAHQPMTALRLFNVATHQNGALIASVPRAHETVETPVAPLSPPRTDVMADLIVLEEYESDVPTAVDGFMEVNGERHGNATAWGRLLGRTKESVRLRLAKSGAVPIEGRYKGGSIAFFSERDVRAACPEFFLALPQLSKDGTVILDDELVATLTYWSTALHVANDTLKTRLTAAGIEAVIASATRGKPARAYRESAMRSVFPEAFQDTLEAAADGFIRTKRGRYATEKQWASELGVTRMILSYRLRQHRLSGVRGRMPGGWIATFYFEEDVRAVVREHLEDLVTSDENNFFFVGGERHAASARWARTFGIPRPIMQKRLREQRPAMRGKDSRGQIRDLYPESLVREVCRDLFREYPVAEVSGFFMHEGKRYGTVKAWQRVLKLSRVTIVRRAAAAGVLPIKAIVRGRLGDAYPEDEFQRIFAQELRLRADTA